VTDVIPRKGGWGGRIIVGHDPDKEWGRTSADAMQLNSRLIRSPAPQKDRRMAVTIVSKDSFENVV